MYRKFNIAIFVIFLLIQNDLWPVTIKPTLLTQKKTKKRGQIGQKKTGASELITLNLTGVSLKNTLQILTNRLGKNLIMDATVREQSLNLSLKNITAEQAFNAILETNDLAYKELPGNIFFVAGSGKIGKQTVVKNIPVKYADAPALQNILKGMVPSKYGVIMSDTRTNTLIIKESPDILAKMEKLLAELDVPTKQVYIQAEIVEVSSIDDTEFGVELLWKNANFKSFEGAAGTGFGLVPAGGGENASTQQAGHLINTDGLPFPIGSGLGIGILNADVSAVLHALKEHNDVNLLSRPRIVTMDNQEATIEVGDEIPFKVLNQFGVTSFEFKDATIELRVKPHIIDSEYVTLNVETKADFPNGFSADGTPIIATRRALTNVKVRNGHTIVIGGLIRDSMIKSQSKVPILGSIPLLGMLFRHQKTTNVKTDLIIFITPIILEDDAMSPRIFQKDFKLRHKVKDKLKINEEK